MAGQSNGRDSSDSRDGGPARALQNQIVIIGAGPAGLTAAYQLAKSGLSPIVLEADTTVGGISRTVQSEGWRFDIGGHRFFTKVRPVEQLWFEILPGEKWLERPRLSRIYYQGKFFDYPLRPANALKNLGLLEALRCVGSYIKVRVRPPDRTDTFEGWVASRFGWRLYHKFFKSYTEKVWGIPATEIRADWAAQRIKNLSLFEAARNAILPKRGKHVVVSLIENFRYPMHGPGMLWEACRDAAMKDGATILLDQKVTRLHRNRDGRVAAATSVDRSGAPTTTPVGQVISSMPLRDLVEAMDPPAPSVVGRAASQLSYRDFMTVALVVPADLGFPDNWIYVHDDSVRVGSIQNFGAWSPYMVEPGTTCLGLEYFVFEGDDLWEMSDDALVGFATGELVQLGLGSAEKVERGFVVRMPKAYPTYDSSYADSVAIIRQWLENEVGNVHPVGRNGMHRYNNQDHSMYTAMLTVENITGDAAHDIWSVNVDAEYHEEIEQRPK